MKRGLAVCVALLIPVVAFAQARPVDPGSPLAPTPVTVLDSTGTQVGEVIDTSVRATAFVKYVLADQNYVVLRVSSQGISGMAAIPNASTPQQARAFFTSSDCSGPAYVPMGPGVVPLQLTKRQAFTLTLFESPTGPPPTPDCPNVPQPLGFSNVLFATTAGACPVAGEWNSPLTFNSYYGFNFGTTCVPMTLQAPSSTIPFAGFDVYHPIENLDQKFKAPFSIP